MDLTPTPEETCRVTACSPGCRRSCCRFTFLNWVSGNLTRRAPGPTPKIRHFPIRQEKKVLAHRIYSIGISIYVTWMADFSDIHVGYHMHHSSSWVGNSFPQQSWASNTLIRPPISWGLVIKLKFPFNKYRGFIRRLGFSLGGVQTDQKERGTGASKNGHMSTVCEKRNAIFVTKTTSQVERTWTYHHHPPCNKTDKKINPSQSVHV